MTNIKTVVLPKNSKITPVLLENHQFVYIRSDNKLIPIKYVYEQLLMENQNEEINYSFC